MTNDDTARMSLIEEALKTTNLTDRQKLIVISTVVNCHVPYTETEIARGKELAKINGWN